MSHKLLLTTLNTDGSFADREDRDVSCGDFCADCFCCMHCVGEHCTENAEGNHRWFCLESHFMETNRHIRENCTAEGDVFINGNDYEV